MTPAVPRRMTSACLIPIAILSATLALLACDSTLAPDSQGALVPGSAAIGPEGNGEAFAPDSIVEGRGIVKLLDIEGGCWVLDAPIGRFAPFELPSAVRVDGLDVAFKGTIVTGIGGLCAAGQPLRLAWIRQAP